MENISHGPAGLGSAEQTLPREEWAFRVKNRLVVIVQPLTLFLHHAGSTPSSLGALGAQQGDGFSAVLQTAL